MRCERCNKAMNFDKNHLNVRNLISNNLILNFTICDDCWKILSEILNQFIKEEK